MWRLSFSSAVVVLLSDLRSRHSVGNVLLVGVDEDDRVLELLIVDHLV